MIVLIRRISFVIVIVAALIISAAGGAFAADFTYTGVVQDSAKYGSDPNSPWMELKERIEGGDSGIELAVDLTQGSGSDYPTIDIDHPVAITSTAARTISHRAMFSIKNGGGLTIGDTTGGIITMKALVGGIKGIEFSDTGRVEFDRVTIDNGTSTGTTIDLSKAGATAEFNDCTVIGSEQNGSAAVIVNTGAFAKFKNAKIGTDVGSKNIGRIISITGGTVEFGGTVNFTNNDGTETDAAVTLESGVLKVGDTGLIEIKDNTGSVFSLNGTATFAAATFSGNKGTAGKTVVVKGGTANFTSPTFSTNTAPSMVSITAGSVTFDTPVFTGNSGNKAVDITGGTLSIVNGRFGGSDTDKNTNTLLYVDGGTLNIDKGAASMTSFSYNTGVSVMVNDGELYADNSFFEHNKGVSVFHSAGGESNFESCRFEQNEGSAANDQVIRVADGQVTFKKGTISQNTAGVNGTIYASGGVTTFTDGATISRNTPRALNMNDGTPEVILSNVTFSENANGAAQVLRGKLRVAQVTFRDNGHITTTPDVNGGAIYWGVDGDVVFEGEGIKSFTGNKAKHGGALYVQGENRAITLPADVAAGVKGLVFTGSQAEDNGGAIYSESDVTVNDGVEFTGNHAKHGGAIYSAKTMTPANPIVSVVLNGGTFTRNFTESGSNGNGGAIYSQTLINVARDSTVKFERNTADGSGGAIYTTATNFDSNASAGNKNAVNIWGGSFESNTATNGDGGAIYAGNGTNGGGVRVAAGTFHDNRAPSNTGRGGAIFCESLLAISTTEGTDTDESSLTFISNRSGANGGAIYVGRSNHPEKPQVSVKAISFKENIATNAGGACFIAREETSQFPTEFGTYFYDCEFRMNGANSGGAICFDKGSGALIENCSFVGNYASGGTTPSGGAITLAGDNVSTSIVSCYFSGNTSSFRGGAIYSKAEAGAGSTANQNKFGILRSYFSSNAVISDASSVAQDGGYGGAVWTDHQIFEVLQSTFVDNRLRNASNGGGALFINSKTYKLGNSTFVGNRADGGGYGGAVMIGARNSTAAGSSQNTSTIFYCTFTNNTVEPNSGLGGAVYYNGAQPGSFSLKVYANVIVGNNGYIGADFFRAADGITTGGYNVIGEYGVVDEKNGDPKGQFWKTDTGVLGAIKDSDLQKDLDPYTTLQVFGVTPTASASSHADELTSYPDKPFVAGTIHLARLANQHTIDTVKIPDTSVAYSLVPKNYIMTEFGVYFGGSYGDIDVLHEDARGVGRNDNSRDPKAGAKIDAGAYQTISGTRPGPDPVPTTGNVVRVAMGGVPNFTLRVGQTVHLTASVYVKDEFGVNGEVRDLSEGVTWTSSNPAVAFIDQYGTMTLLSQGETIITATSIGYMTTAYPSGAPRRATDSKRIVVNLPYSYINASSNVWNAVDSYNSALSNAGAQMSLADINPAATGGTAFISGFRSEFGIDPMHITAFDIAGSPSPSYNAPSTTYNGAERAVRPSMGVSMGTQMPSGGGAIALRFSYSLTWGEVSELLGRQTTSLNASNAEELFRVLSIVFKDESGNAVPVIGKNSGISYANVIGSNALRIGTLDARAGGVDAAGGDDRFVMDLELMISDAKANGSNTAKMINGMIVVGDGTPNGRINGNMWLLAPNSGGGNSGGSGGSGSGSGGSGEGGGGGGCAAGAFALALIAIPFALRMKKR